MSRDTRIDPVEVTVTYLEMTAPPGRYPPLPMGRAIALLRTDRVPRHFYRYLIDRVGRRWHWVNALRMSDSDLDAILEEAGRDIRVLYLGGCPAGFFHIRPADDGALELAFFGLMEEATGTGLGRWFLGAAIEAAWSANPTCLRVQTCTLDHPAALPLYQKLGFSPVGQSVESVSPLSLPERAEILARP